MNLWNRHLLLACSLVIVISKWHCYWTNRTYNILSIIIVILVVSKYQISLLWKRINKWTKWVIIVCNRNSSCWRRHWLICLKGLGIDWGCYLLKCFLLANWAFFWNLCLAVKLFLADVAPIFCHLLKKNNYYTSNLNILFNLY